MASEKIRRCPPETVLLSWLHGELDPVRETGIELHVAACPACRSRVQEDRRIGRVIRAGETLLAERPAALDPARILERSHRIQGEEALLIRFLQKLSAAAAILVLAGAVAISWKAAEGPRVSEAEARIHPVEAKTSIRHLAVQPVALSLIDEESAIQIVIRR